MVIVRVILIVTDLVLIFAALLNFNVCDFTGTAVNRFRWRFYEAACRLPVVASDHVSKFLFLFLAI